MSYFNEFKKIEPEESEDGENLEKKDIETRLQDLESALGELLYNDGKEHNIKPYKNLHKRVLQLESIEKILADKREIELDTHLSEKDCELEIDGRSDGEIVFMKEIEDRIGALERNVYSLVESPEYYYASSADETNKDNTDKDNADKGNTDKEIELETAKIMKEGLSENDINDDFDLTQSYNILKKL